MGYTRDQWRKMRMKWIKAHLNLGDCYGFGRFSHRVKHMCKTIIREIGVQRDRSFGGGSRCVEVAFASQVVSQFRIGFGQVRTELYRLARQFDREVKGSRAQIFVVQGI